MTTRTDPQALRAAVAWTGLMRRAHAARRRSDRYGYAALACAWLAALSWVTGTAVAVLPLLIAGAALALVATHQGIVARRLGRAATDKRRQAWGESR